MSETKCNPNNTGPEEGCLPLEVRPWNLFWLQPTVILLSCCSQRQTQATHQDTKGEGEKVKGMTANPLSLKSVRLRDLRISLSSTNLNSSARFRWWHCNRDFSGGSTDYVVVIDTRIFAFPEAYCCISRSFKNSSQWLIGQNRTQLQKGRRRKRRERRTHFKTGGYIRRRKRKGCIVKHGWIPL